MAKLGSRSGPFYSAKAAVEAAKLAGRKLGLTENELLEYMTRLRKIQGGPKRALCGETSGPAGYVVHGAIPSPQVLARNAVTCGSR